MEVIYVAAVNLLLFSGWVARCGKDEPRAALPRNTVPLFAVSGLASVIGGLLLFSGFFLFAWWLPFVAVAIFKLSGRFVLRLMASRHHSLASYSIVSGLFGFMATAVIAADVYFLWK